MYKVSLQSTLVVSVEHLEIVYSIMFFRSIISHMKEKSASSVTYVHMLPYLRDIWSLTC
jgi:hypothetical protein